MSLLTFTPPEASGDYFNEGAQESHKPRTLTAAFGDGYVQEAGDGLNADLAELSPTWRNLSWEDATSIHNFFAQHKAYIPFLFTLPGEDTERKWKCTEWGRTWNSAGLVDVSATWKEVAYPA